ncbi:MAG: extracellular solute-binding protein [Anaerolineae bacterium]|nr:extracellular solute-binding protein [Anaerolineae bacterium]
MFRRSHIALAVVLLLSLVLTAAAPLGAQEMGVELTAEETLGGTATGVVYEKKDSIFNGEPITIEIWDWFTSRTVLWQAWAPLYTELYPNVTFEITRIPGADYWTKMVAAIPAGEGPDIYAFHNEQRSVFVENELMMPFPEDMFDPAFYLENYYGYPEGHFQDDEGRIRYLNYGNMAPLLYVNTRMWEEAGLTEADAPQTWDELIELATRLTQYDSAGNIDVAGFAFNTDIQGLWTDLTRQQGRYIYTADAKGCQIDNPGSRRALEIIGSWYDANVNSRDFLTTYEAFTTERAAIIYSMTWLSGNLRVNFPDFEYFTLLAPTLSGEPLPVIAQSNYDVSHVVSVNKPPERQAVSWDFMHWLHSQDEYLVDMALTLNIPPGYKKLGTHPRILADTALSQVVQELPYAIYPGDFPPAFWDSTQIFQDSIIAGGISIDDMIAQAQEICDRGMQLQDYWIVERTYQNADAMIPDQP